MEDIEGFITDPVLPVMIIIDQYRLVGFPDFTAHPLTHFYAPAQLVFKKSHADPHFHFPVPGVEEIDKSVLRAAQPGGPVEDGFQ